MHFPFHASLILSSEGSQILALTLDIALKLRYLGETIVFACEEPRPDSQYAIALLNDTIVDMEIDFSKGALQERFAINFILNSLWNSSQLCPDNSTTNSTDYGLTQARARSLMGNVTVSLFASMGITPTKGDLSRFGSSTLLMMYVNLLGFVYMYYFASVSLSMGYFAAFVHITKRHPRPLHNAIAIGVRVLLGVFLLALVTFSRNFDLTYFFMTSPIIIFTFALALFKGEFFALSGRSILIQLQFSWSIDCWTGSRCRNRAISVDRGARAVLYRLFESHPKPTTLRTRIPRKRKDERVETSGCIKISEWITVWHGIGVSRWSKADVVRFIIIIIYR